MIDYDFCRTAKLTAVDLLIWLDIVDHNTRQYDYIYLEDFFGFPMRLAGHNNEILQVGESHDTFDRWANSVYLKFNLAKQVDKKALSTL